MMDLLTGTTLFLFFCVVGVGYVLVRAIRIDRIWFIGIDPVRSERSLLFWYCFACAVFAFVGGAFGLFVLMAAVL
jgi:hypothetical protein